jgi:GDP-D-mannose dehydratase
MTKKALITGVTGQDGSYLAEFLLEKDYEVHGIKRRTSSFNTQRIDHIYQDPHLNHKNFILHYGDLTDTSNLTRILQEVQPDEVYNLGAQSHVAVSFESPRRGETFVTRKITRALCHISQGLEACLYLGNMDALRDWGHAKDYVRMQWMMLQQEVADDFVIATDKQISVRLSAAELGIELKFIISVIGDQCPHVSVGDVRVRVDPRYFRPTEVETLLGDPTKAKEKLGWVPEITVEKMCAEMVAYDLEQAKQHALLKAHGHDVNIAIE